MRIFATVSVAIPLIATLPFGCNNRGSASQRSESLEPSENKHAVSGVGETSSVASAARVLPDPVKFDDVLVTEGNTHNLGFTLEYRARRMPVDAGQTLRKAVEVCRGGGRMLCTETQWLRACEQHTQIGQMQSWTMSRRTNMMVVAGGGDCGLRDLANDEDALPNRVGICCERTVVLRTGGVGPWLGPGSRLPLRFERALDEGDVASMRRLFADLVIRDGRKWSSTELIAREVAERKRIGWTVFDTCDMRVGPVVVDKLDTGVERKQGTLLSCRTVAEYDASVVDYMTLFGIVGRDENSYRIAQIDHRGAEGVPGAR